MGRPKGSKNKATLLKRAIKAAQKEDVKPVVAVATPEARVKVEVVPEYRHLWERTVKRCEELRTYYGGQKDFEERIWNKIDRIYMANSAQEAEGYAKKAEDSYFFHLAAQWSAGKIPGPVTTANLEKKANSAEGLAKLLDRDGKAEKAEEYRAKAKAFRLAAATAEVDLPPWLKNS
jgi:hypothetical protein